MAVSLLLKSKEFLTGGICLARLFNVVNWYIGLDNNVVTYSLVDSRFTASNSAEVDGFYRSSERDFKL